MPPDHTTGHSIFNLIPDPRKGGFADSRELSIDLPDSERLEFDTESESELERQFPSTMTLLCRVWGKPDAIKAFRTLILDRDGRVRRWPREAWEEIILLRNVHDAAYLHGRGLPADPQTGLVNPDDYPVLEVRYRHVLDRITARWGKPGEFHEFFQRLILDDRGDRQGWPADAWAELVFLQQVHDRAFGKRRLNVGDPLGQVTRAGH